MKVAIRYYSRGGNTKKPAEALLHLSGVILKFEYYLTHNTPCCVIPPDTSYYATRGIMCQEVFLIFFCDMII